MRVGVREGAAVGVTKGVMVGVSVGVTKDDSRRGFFPPEDHWEEVERQNYYQKKGKSEEIKRNGKPKKVKAKSKRVLKCHLPINPFPLGLVEEVTAVTHCGSSALDVDWHFALLVTGVDPIQSSLHDISYKNMHNLDNDARI
jgi:hypothetical protein